MEFYPGNLVRFNTSWLLPCGALAVQEGMALNKAGRFSTGAMGFPDLTASCKCRTTQTPGMLCQRRQHSLVQSMSRLSDDSPAKQTQKKAVKLSFQCFFQTRRCHALQIINGRFCEIWPIFKWCLFFIQIIVFTNLVLLVFYLGLLLLGLVLYRQYNCHCHV